MDGYGGDDHVAEVQGSALPSVVALNLASQTGGWRRYGEVLQAGKEFFGGGFFLGPHAGVNLGDIDGTTGQNMTSLNQLQQKGRTATLIVQGVNDDAGIEQECGHGQRVVTFSKRWSYSWRSFFTHLAAPCLSSGWSLSFHAPAAPSNALIWRRRINSFSAAWVRNVLRLRLPTKVSISATNCCGMTIWVRLVFIRLGIMCLNGSLGRPTCSLTYNGILSKVVSSSVPPRVEEPPGFQGETCSTACPRTGSRVRRRPRIRCACVSDAAV